MHPRPDPRTETPTGPAPLLHTGHPQVRFQPARRQLTDLHGLTLLAIPAGVSRLELRRLVVAVLGPVTDLGSDRGGRALTLLGALLADPARAGRLFQAQADFEIRHNAFITWLRYTGPGEARMEADRLWRGARNLRAGAATPAEKRAATQAETALRTHLERHHLSESDCVRLDRKAQLTRAALYTRQEHEAADRAAERFARDGRLGPARARRDAWWLSPARTDLDADWLQAAASLRAAGITTGLYDIRAHNQERARLRRAGVPRPTAAETVTLRRPGRLDRGRARLNPQHVYDMTRGGRALHYFMQDAIKALAFKGPEVRRRRLDAVLDRHAGSLHGTRLDVLLRAVERAQQLPAGTLGARPRWAPPVVPNSTPPNPGHAGQPAQPPLFT